MELARSNISDLNRISNQLVISNNLLESIDPLNKMLLDSSLIEKAIKLAKNSRLVSDAYYDPFEFYNFEPDKFQNLVKSNITNLNVNVQSYFYYTFPKSVNEERVLYHIPFYGYTLRFLFGIIINQKCPNLFIKNIFGGRDEVFSLKAVDDYKAIVNDFINWQRINLNSGNYEYMISLDIKKYFHNINADYLIDILCSILDTHRQTYFIKLLSNLLKFRYEKISNNEKIIAHNNLGLVVGGLIDDYIANIYLTNLDKRLSKIKSIEYGRMTDDLKLFVKNKNEGIEIIKIINQELQSIGLELNHEKTQWTSRYDSELEIQKCFIRSANYGGVINLSNKDEIDEDDENSINIDTCDIKELVREKLVHDYIITLINISSRYIKRKQINDLEYVIKNVFTTQRFFTFVINTYYTLIIRYDFEYGINKIIEFLTASEVNNYSKYIIIRKLFLEPDLDYFFVFRAKKQNFETEIYNVLGLFSISDNYILSNTSKFILKYYKSPEYWEPIINDLLKDKVSNKDKLIRYLDYYMSIAPTNNKAKFILANTYLENNLFSKAYDLYIQLNPTKQEVIKDVYLKIIKCLKSLKKYQELIKYQELLFNLSNDKSIFFDIAYTYGELNEHQLCLEFYDKYLLYNPKSSAAHNNRAVAKKKLNDFQGALIDYKKAIELDPLDELYSKNLKILEDELNS